MLRSAARKTLLQGADPEYRRSLLYSVIDSGLFSMMMGFGEAFIVPLALFHGFGGVEIGLLAALPILAGALLQSMSGTFISLFRSRRRMVLFFVSMQILAFPLFMLGIIYDTGSFVLFLAVCVLYWGAGIALNPAWASWMTSLSRGIRREVYFARRSQFSSVFMLLSMLAGGFLMRHFQHHQLAGRGFLLVLGLAMISRMISWVFLWLKKEPPLQGNEGITPSQFVRDGLHIARSPQAGLILVVVLFNSGVFFAAPYFTPYMLNDLGLGYEQFVIIQSVGILSKVLFLPAWGLISSQYGIRKPLLLAMGMAAVLPMLWLFSGSFYYLCLIHVLTGFVWGGFELSAFNMMMKSYRGHKEVSCWAWFNTFNGTGQVLFSGISGILQTRGLLTIFQVFAISGLIRVLPVIVWGRRIAEKEEYPVIGYHQLFMRIISLRLGMRPITFDEGDE